MVRTRSNSEWPARVELIPGAREKVVYKNLSVPYREPAQVPLA